MLFAATAGLAVLGLIARFRRPLTILEFFLALYLLTLIVFPYRQKRYLAPIVPLYCYYALVGMQILRPKPVRTAVMVALLLAIGASYALKYSTLEFGPIRKGIAQQQARDLFAYVLAETTPRDVLIFRKPRVLAFYTGRRSAVYHEPEQRPALWDYFSRIGATYLVTSPLDSKWFRKFVDDSQPRLAAVYANSDFVVYRIEAAP